VAEVRFAPDGKTVMSIDGEGLARVWETTTGRECFHFQLPQGLMAGWRLTPDNRVLLTWESGGVIKAWDTATGKLLRELAGGAPTHGRVCLSPDARTVVDMARNEDTGRPYFRIWDLAAGKDLRHIVPALRKNQRVFYPYQISFLAHGKTLAVLGTVGGKPVLCLWDFTTGKELQVFAERPRRGNLHTLAPNGKIGADLFTDRDKALRVRLIDLASGKKIHDLSPALGKVSADDFLTHHYTPLDFSPDSTTLAAVDMDDGLRLWDVATGKPLPSSALPKNSVRGMAFAPDSQTIAVGTLDARLFLFQVKRGKQLYELNGYTRALG
jgi:WD40 repeat protein